MENKTVQESNSSSTEITNVTKILEDPPHDTMKNERPQLTISLKKCALCSYKYKGKNKHQENQEHLYQKHFKEKFFEEFADKLIQSLPKCPHEYCDFSYKRHKKGTKAKLFFHYFRKHGILKKYFDKAMLKPQSNSKPPPEILKPITDTKSHESLKELISKEDIEDAKTSGFLENYPEDEPMLEPEIEPEVKPEIEPEFEPEIKLEPEPQSNQKPAKGNQYSVARKIEIITKYNNEDISQSQLSREYGISRRSIRNWVIDQSKIIDDKSGSSGKISKSLFKPRKRKRSSVDAISISQNDIRKHSMELRKSKILPNNISEFEKSKYKDINNEETDALVIQSDSRFQEINIETKDEVKNGPSQNISIGSVSYSQEALSIFQASLENPKSNVPAVSNQDNAGDKMASLMKSKPGPKSKQLTSDNPQQAIPKHKPGPKSKRKHFHGKTAKLLQKNETLLTRENGEKKNYVTKSKDNISDGSNIITQKNRSIFSNEQLQHMKTSYLQNR